MLIPSIGEYFQNVSNTYFTWLGHVPTVFISNPEYAKQILSKTYTKIDNIKDNYGICIIWSSRSLTPPLITSFKETIKITSASDFMSTVDVISKDILRNLNNFVGNQETSLLPILEKIEGIAYRTGLPFLYEKFAQIKKDVSIIEILKTSNKNLF